MFQEIIELIASDNPAKLAAKSVCSFKRGSYAIMSCGIATDGPRTHLACGHDDRCVTYAINQRVVTPRPNSPGQYYINNPQASFFCFRLVTLETAYLTLAFTALM